MSFSFFDIDVLRRKFCRNYLSFYEDFCFEIVPPLPLRIYFDPSLSFTTCSICLFKKWYFEGIKPKKYCVIQPSFRTNTYKEIHSSEDLKYTASLTICGTFLPTSRFRFRDDFEQAILWQAKFLSDWLNRGQFIRLTTPRRLNALFSHKCRETLRCLGINMVQDDDGLLWSYGMENTQGLGTRWEIVSNHACYNWGNVIAVYHGQEPIGIESGGSVEVALQGILDLPHKIFANQYCGTEIATEIAHSGKIAVKYFDTLDVIATILWETRTETVLPLQLSAILEQYVRAFKSLLVLMRIDCCTYERHIALYERFHTGWKRFPGSLCNQIRERIFHQWNLFILTASLARKERYRWRGFSPLERQAILLAAAHPELLWFEGEGRSK